MIVDVEARNASLDGDYGTTRGPNAADSHQLALYDADGVEVTGPGYARATILPAAWAPADGGQKSAVAQFAAPTGAWTVASTWVLHGDDGYAWDSAELVDPLEVTTASPTGPTIVVTVRYPDQINL